MNTMFVCPKCEKLNRVPLKQIPALQPICGSCKTDLPIHDGLQDVSDSGLSKLIRSADGLVIVDFWAEWCGPCKAFAPTFKAAARELSDHFIFAKLNTEAHPLAAQTFRIRGIPTLILFKNGAEVDRQSGAMSLPMLMEYLGRWKLT